MPSKRKKPKSGTVTEIKSHEIEVFPAKRFFVEMLTRDIDLADSILDLLDNCVDGVRRLLKLKCHTPKDLEKPYTGFHADIRYDGRTFTIEDNCGGIPLEAAVHYAFRFGKPADFTANQDGTIGLVGIGMKRAILKMGRYCLVHSHHKEDTFNVEITPEWLARDDDWLLHYKESKPQLQRHGSKIVVSQLAEGISEEFKSDLFKKKLWEKIEGAFAILIAKGFKVTINGDAVSSEIPSLLWQDDLEDDRGIRPYIYKTRLEEVDVYLAVGFYEPTGQRNDEEDTQRYYQSAAAGWTVACNDRVVLYRDKSEDTGWGTDSVPEFHTQFIGIAGFAEFKSDDPRRLPFTTTKQGVDGQSKIFIHVFDKMREATKIFTDWTNKFKDYSSQSREIFRSARPRNVEEIKKISGPLSQAKAGRAEFVAAAKLPKPISDRQERVISFKKTEQEIRKVSRTLFGMPDAKLSRIGEECFDRVLREDV